MIQNDLMNPELLHAIRGNESDDIIEHFGIKGMRWGFRKNRSERSKMRQLKKASRKARAAWNKKYHSRHMMTSHDLREATNRLRLENDFAEQVQRSNRLSNPGGQKSFGSFGRETGKLIRDTAVKTITKDLLTKNPKNYSQLTKNLATLGRDTGHAFNETVKIFK